MTKFLRVLPMAFEVARIAEAAVPVGGKGKEKLRFALDVAETAYETEEDLRGAWGDKSKFLEATTRAVAMAVALLNAAGVFQKA